MARPDVRDLLSARFVSGGRGERDRDGLAGFDCWGGVMETFRRFGVEVPEFEEDPDNPLGIGAIFLDQAESGPWERLDEPETPCLVAMTTSVRHPEAHNHFGVYVGEGRFFHMQRKRGPGLARLSDHPWPRLVRSFWRYTGGAALAGDHRPQIPEGAAMVVWMPNFVDPRQKVVEFVAPGRAVFAYRPVARDIEAVLDVSGELELAASVNGDLLTASQERAVTVRAGDCVIFRVVPRGGGGGGKNPIAAVASIALMVAAPVVAPYLSAGLMGLPMTSMFAGIAGTLSPFMTAVIGGALTMVGGTLINAVLPPGTPTKGGGLGSTSLESSPTYSWSAEPNPTRNGRPVPILYGDKTGIVPTLLTRYIETDGDKQYLNMLFMVAEGVLDDIYDIEIDDNPLANFNHVSLEKRLGTIDQAPISWFNDTISERSVGARLSTDWHTVTTEGTAIEALGIGLNFYKGLGQSDGSFDLQPLTVIVEAETRCVGGTWVSFGEFPITASQQSAVRRYYRMNGLAAGQHELRVRFKTAPPEGIEFLSDCYWEYVHEIIPEDFALPHSGLFALRALATDQLSGARPRVTCSARRNTVAVWNPATAQYEDRDARNPAWAAWDLAHHYRYGAGAPVDRIIYDDFSGAAAWCETKGLTGSLYLDSPMDVQAYWDHMGRFGRFRVVTRGTRIGCVSDRPVEHPEQGMVVTEANVLLGSFGVKHLDTRDRADAIRVTYYDKVKGRTTFLAPGAFYGQITGRAPRVREETLYWVDEYQPAWAWAEYMLRCNRYLVETIEREMSVSAIGALPGDVIQVTTVFGSQTGRVQSAALGQVQLNCTVQLAPGKSYRLWVMHTDRQSPDTGQELVEAVDCMGVLEPTVTDTLFTAEPLAHDPSPGAVVAFGEPATTVKWYRVLSISRSGGSKVRRKLEALEYAPEVHQDEGVAPAIESAAVGAAVAGLQAGIFDRFEDGVQKKVVSLFWRGLAVEWQVYARRPNQTSWRLVGSTRETQMDVYNLEMGHVYEFSVTDRRSPDSGETVQIDFGTAALSGMIQSVTVLDATEGIVPVTVDVNGATDFVQVVM